MSEQERVHQIMQEMHRGNDDVDKLEFDPYSKTIRPASSYRDPDKTMVVTPSDMEHFTSGGDK